MLRLFTLTLIALSFLTAPTAKAHEGDHSADTAFINQAIETYIRNNPGVIIESLEQYQQDQIALQEKSAEESLAKHKAYLENGTLPYAGNKDGDVIVVEFFDYNCGYCKRAFDDIQILLEADKNVKFVFVELPILGPSSLETAKWAMAAAKQDKYFDYHAALMKFSGNKTEQSLAAVAETIGLDLEKMKEDMNDPKIIDEIEKNRSVAKEIGVNGTPGFIINGQIYRGYLGYDGMKAVIDEARNNNTES